VYREPTLIIQSGLEPAAIVVDSGVLSHIISLSNLEDHIRNITKPLQDRIKELDGEILKLKAKIGEFEGLKSFWENEISIRENQIKSLKTQISRQNFITLGLLVLGLMLGFVGGLLAGKIRKEEIVVRRRERRR